MIHLASQGRALNFEILKTRLELAQDDVARPIIVLPSAGYDGAGLASPAGPFFMRR
jgi:hypothetical protein